MSKQIIMKVWICAGLVFTVGTVLAAPAEYINPLSVKIADPAILKTANGDYMYYLAGTGTQRYVSNDLINWRRAGSYINLSDYLTYTGLWASELVEKDGRFYYYFCVPVDAAGKRAIFVADADSPDDTFRPLPFPAEGQTWQPVWSQTNSIIDPHVFIDDDGSPYLFYNRDIGQLRVIRLNANMYQTIGGSAINLLSVTQAWENNWMEGASVIKHNGIYYLTWSSNYWGGHAYAVGYATSNLPMGPYTKSTANPMLKQWLTYPGYPYQDNPPLVEQIDPDNIGYSSPGHHGFVRSPDGTELFICYHTKIGTQFEGQRHLCIDRVVFTPQASGPDQMHIDQEGNNAPTRTPRPYPSGAAYPHTARMDEFEGDTLDRAFWSNIWGENDSLWSVANGALNITMTSGDMWQESTTAQNVFLQKAPAGDWDITAKVTMPALSDITQAYIVVWQDTNNYVMLRPWKWGTTSFVDHMREVNGVTTHARPIIPLLPNPFYLRIQKSCGNYYQCLLSTDGQTWEPYGPNYYAAFTDIYVGLGANKSGVVSSAYQANIEWFDIQRKPDINTDGIVNLQDFSQLAAEWLKADCFPHPLSDVDNDCTVDTADFEMLAAQWWASCSCQE